MCDSYLLLATTTVPASDTHNIAKVFTALESYYIGKYRTYRRALKWRKSGWGWERVSTSQSCRCRVLNRKMSTNDFIFLAFSVSVFSSMPIDLYEIMNFLSSWVDAKHFAEIGRERGWDREKCNAACRIPYARFVRSIAFCVHETMHPLLPII